MNFPHNRFGKRLKTMLKVDFRRMFTMPLFYIMVGACLVMPILILVMTTMMDGTVSVNPQTGVETVVEGFDNVWQIIGSASTAESTMSMDMTAMCNINLLYFIVSALVCVFVAQDFRSGYAKNLFTVRAKKSDYVISKTAVCFVGGAAMILAFFGGAMLGGSIAGLPYTMEGFSATTIAACVLSKMLLVGVFVALYLMWSIIAKQRLWLSLVGSMMTGMFLFMMIPMLTPLDATAVHILGCLAGSLLLGLGLGAISNQILKKTSLV
ncbi:MAG: ABC transporter permease [Oscillospiraceae bacterium]|nr:ABC transporter permease [Oscillospiraceae bacterium]